MLSVLAIAQQKASIHTVRPEPVNSFKKVKVSDYKKHTSFSNPSQKINATGSAWFNQLDYIELAFPETQVISAMHVFPDSTIILGFGAGNVPVYSWIHKAANYMDPSFMGQQNIITDKLTTYTLDSIAVGYLYQRHSANSITDSLIFTVIGENHNLDWTPSSGQYPYQDITYNYTANDIAVGTPSMTPVLKRISVPLKIQDTCEGGKYKQIKVGTSGISPQTNSKKIGVVVSYKPGYTWTLTDTLIDSHRTNAFFILSSEQNGDNTDPTIFGTANDYTSDMNMSYILPTDVRYNMSTLGCNGFLVPTYAYTTPFPYESHDIGYKLTVSVTGIKELETNGFALQQNSPNPFTKETTVKYQLAKDANNVLFSVTDITGRIISSEKVNSATGTHSVKLGNYAAGMYYYSLNVDGKVISKKMIVE